MITLDSLQGLSRAIELKGALIEADNRVNPQHIQPPRTAASMLGLAVSPTTLDTLLLPVFDQEGIIFTRGVVKTSNRVPMVSGKVTEGSIIEFEDENQNSIFGLVMEPPLLTKKQGVYIRKLTKTQVQELAARNPLIPKVHLSEKDLKPLKVLPSSNQYRLPAFLSFLDPVQQAVWHILKGSMTLSFWKRATFIDTLLWMYILLVVIVLSFMIYMSIKK